MNPLVMTWSISFPSNLVERVSGWVSEPKVNCLLNFIPVMFHWSWFGLVTLRDYVIVVPGIVFQEPYVKAVVNMTEIKVAAEITYVIVMLVVNWRNWEWSHPSSLHLFIDICQVNVL